MFVYRNLLHPIMAFDPDFVACRQVLYDDVSHVLSISVSLTIQTMNRTEYGLITPKSSVLTCNRL